MKKILIASLLAASSLGASAEGAYIGFGGGQGEVAFSPINVSPATLSEENTDQAYKAFLGVAISDNLAVEVGYQSMGTYYQNAAFAGSNAKIEYKGSAILLDLVGKIPLTDNFSIFAKLGAARTTLEVTQTADGIFSGLASAPVEQKETNFRFGAGAQYHLSKGVAIRIEYERTTDVGDQSTTGESDVDYMGAAIAFGF